MGSHALGADLVYALPGASVSVMAPESAVAFLWNDRITPERSRADLVAEWAGHPRRSGLCRRGRQH